MEYNLRSFKTDLKTLEKIYSTKSVAPARIERWILRLQNIADNVTPYYLITLRVNEDADEFIHFVSEMATPAAMIILRHYTLNV